MTEFNFYSVNLFDGRSMEAGSTKDASDSRRTEINVPSYSRFASREADSYGNLTGYRDGVGLVSGLRSVMYGEALLVKSESRLEHGKFTTCTVQAFNLRLDGLRSLVKDEERTYSQTGPKIPTNFAETWSRLACASGKQISQTELDFYNRTLATCERWLVSYLESLAKRCVFQVGVIFISGDLLSVQPGSKVIPSGELLRFPSGMELLGRTVGALGEIIDGLASPKISEYRLIEAEAPSIISRSSVCEPLKTGVLAIDSLIPVGRGQRQLIIGDRQTGKTSLALEAVICQTQLKHLYLMSSLLRLKQSQFVSSILENLQISAWLYDRQPYESPYGHESRMLGIYDRHCADALTSNGYSMPEPSFAILLNLPLCRLDVENFLSKISRPCPEYDEVKPLAQSVSGGLPDVSPVITYFEFLSCQEELYSNVSTDRSLSGSSGLVAPKLIYSSSIRRWDCCFGEDSVGLLQFYLPKFEDLVTFILAMNSSWCHSNFLKISIDGVYASPEKVQLPLFSSSNCLRDTDQGGTLPDDITVRPFLSDVSSRLVSRSGLSHGEIPAVVVGLAPTMKDVLVILFSSLAALQPSFRFSESSHGQGISGDETESTCLTSLMDLSPLLWPSQKKVEDNHICTRFNHGGSFNGINTAEGRWISPWDSISFLEQSLRRFLDYSERKEKGSFCVYVSIGQKTSFVSALIRSLKASKFPDLHIGDLGFFMVAGGLNLTLRYHPSTCCPGLAPIINGALLENGFDGSALLAEGNTSYSEQSLNLSGNASDMMSMPPACAYDYTLIVSPVSDSTAAAQYLAPYSGAAFAEYLAGRGEDVLIVFDDLTKQAVAYRQISLSFYRPPGREAFPGDIFFVHARLLERIAKTKAASITAFPIVETQCGDVSSFIPTNVISITDGQAILKKELHSAGQIPGLDVGLSVSRVGSAAQSFLVKKYASSLKLVLAQYKEVLSFSKFQEDVSDDVRKSLDQGVVLLELFKHDRFEAVCEFYQVILLILAVSPRSFLASPPKNFFISKEDRVSGEFLTGLRRHTFRFVIGTTYFSLFAGANQNETSPGNGTEKVFVHNEPLRKFLVQKITKRATSSPSRLVPPEDFRRYVDTLSICRFITSPVSTATRTPSEGVGAVSDMTGTTLPLSVNYNFQKSSLPYYFRPFGLNDIFTACDSTHFSVTYRSAEIFMMLLSKRFLELLTRGSSSHCIDAPKYERCMQLLRDLPEASQFTNGLNLIDEEATSESPSSTTSRGRNHEVLTFPAPRKFFINTERQLASRFLEDFSNLFFLDYCLCFNTCDSSY